MTEGHSRRAISPEPEGPITYQTLPLEEASPQEEGAAPIDSGGWDATKPIGKSNPPRAKAWQKGGPSPNPRGAPKKAKLGRWTAKLNQNFPGSTVTFRELINLAVLRKAIAGNPAALKISEDRKLWEQRVQLLKERQEAEDRERARQDAERTQEQKNAAALRIFGDALQTVVPGFLDVLDKLVNLGIIERADGFYRIVPAVEIHCRGLDDLS